ncbi:MAG: hypothetical protein V3S14_03490 [Anaerolineae bacterium]
MRRAHVYLLASEEGVALVDSGLAGDADQIVAQAQESARKLADLPVEVLCLGHGEPILKMWGREYGRQWGSASCIGPGGDAGSSSGCYRPSLCAGTARVMVTRATRCSRN